MPSIKRITTLLLVIACIVTADAAEPQTTTLHVIGLKQPVEILVDKWGVPHIYAKDFDDGFSPRVSKKQESTVDLNRGTEAQQKECNDNEC